jgi:hypothetical protein
VWGSPWYGNSGYSDIVVTQCPGTLDPVLATDGRVYNNPCEAQLAGAGVVRRVSPSALKDYVTTGDVIPGVPNIALLAGAGIAAYLLFFRKKRR